MAKIRAMTSVVLGLLIMSSACIRIQVEVPKSSSTTEHRGPDPAKEDKNSQPDSIDKERERKEIPGTSLRSDYLFFTQGGGKPCATDKNLTRAVAQQTGNWCWAASAEGVLSFHKIDLPQCEAVTKLNAGDRTQDGKPFCCDKDNAVYDANCAQNGYTWEVFDRYDIFYRWRAGALNEERIAQEICENGPFTYSIDDGGGGGHTLVVRDYWIADGEMWLEVDNHESYYDEPRGFQPMLFLEYKEGRISRDGKPNIVDYNFVRINTPQD